MLAYWTGRDPERMDRIFRSSALMREKWNREDYFENTVRTAIDNCASIYDPDKCEADKEDVLRELHVQRMNADWKSMEACMVYRAHISLVEEHPRFVEKGEIKSIHGKDVVVPETGMIITDFEEFGVYDTRLRPDPKDGASTARTMFMGYEEYPDRWDEIANLFSRDAVLSRSLEALEQEKAKRGTSPVDKAFLAEIEGWRESLAKEIYKRNRWLSRRDLNYAVQMTIDRLVFLRICEDRGVEDYGRLGELLDRDRVYRELLGMFRDADNRYNSGLFHFGEERGKEESPDGLTPELKIHDAPLKRIIRRLYYPKSPYQFSVMPVEILGQVYEQFLGKVIDITPRDSAVVEEKPEVRKAGGVYYTPAYIVDRIVERTVGKLVEGKTPRQVSNLKIVDPACGSGSFLVGSYDYLLDWHRRWYVADGPEKHRNVLYEGPGGE